MRDTAWWAFWRRFWYGTGFGAFWVGVFTLVYFMYFYVPPSCFDGSQNAGEAGVDCGGACVRICAFEVSEPYIRWSKSFRVRDGQYNAVAYVENENPSAATKELRYTFSLYDDQGLITQQSGVTILPPDSVYPIFAGPILTGDRIPTNTFIELEPAEVWQPGESSRNLFTVSDRTLGGVDSLPRLHAAVRNTQLTPETDVEVVATIFDARGNALNSSRTYVDYFGPQSVQDIVFTWPEPIAKTLRSCEIPTDVVVAIDLSGSMNDDSDNPPEPISSVLLAAEAFANRLRDKDQAAVVTFATDAVTDLPLGTDLSGAAAQIAALSIAPAEEVGSTNTGDAFVRALEELSSERHNDNARKIMVILTDGLATAPDEEPEEYAIEKATILKEAGVDVYAIGLGEKVNMEFVRTIATDPSFAYQALTKDQVDQIYQTITSSICEDGPAVIDIIVKTDAGFTPLR